MIRILIELYFALSICIALAFIDRTEYAIEQNWKHRTDVGAGYMPIKLPTIESIHYVWFPSVIIIKAWQFIHRM